jgi:hypothetical protein
MPHFLQVRDSVWKHGLILPIYLWRGAHLDGLIRHQCAMECGREVKFFECRWEEQAAQILFSLHPERAMLQFGHGLSLRSQCTLFAARPERVLAARKATEGPPPPKPYRRRDYTKRMYLRLPEQTKRELVATAEELIVEQREVIVAALRCVPRNLLKSELQRMRMKGPQSARGGAKKKCV